MTLLLAPAVLAQNLPAQCDAERLTPIIATMSRNCQTLLGGALASGTALTDATQCPCFLEVPEWKASFLTCRALATDQVSFYATYQRCNAPRPSLGSPPSPPPSISLHSPAPPSIPVCATASLVAAISSTSASCQVLLGGALASGASLSDAVQCPCFLELPESTASEFQCRARATSRSSLYSTYLYCKANRPYSWKWLFTWDFSWGYRWLGTSWGFGWGLPGWGWKWSQ